MSDFNNPFSICFVLMKQRYNDYDNSIEKLNFVNRNDKINVFINFESVLSNLSMIKDIDNKLLLERNFPIILESEALNLCAHYKRFFVDNGLPTRVFLYYTDLESDNFTNFKYNDEFRSYYSNKYLRNPRFELLGTKMVNTIIPDLKKILEFIPNVNFISARNIDGSLIPYIIAQSDPSYKNFIITQDKYDSQYMLYNNKFCTHYLRRPIGAPAKVYTRLEDLIRALIGDDSAMDLLINPAFYSMFVGVDGDKPRSIDPIKGVGMKTLVKYLNDAVSGGKLTKDTESINLIKEAIPSDIASDMGINFNCTNLESQYSDLSVDDIFKITNQITNRFDFSSLLELNSTRFKNYPLMLNELTSEVRC